LLKLTIKLSPVISTGCFKPNISSIVGAISPSFPFFSLIFTADHGNCDIMLDDNNNVITSHTTSPVPFIVTDKNNHITVSKI